MTPSEWRLSIGGMVDNPIELTFEELLDREIVERDITLVCVSNEVGGRYAGTARWLGVPLASLLEEAGVQPGADQLVSRSVDGWTAGSPVQAVMDGRDAMVAIGMNGEPLPVEHGFPARLVVPGLYGFVSATKWVTQLELTTFDAYDPYWAAARLGEAGPDQDDGPHRHAPRAWPRSIPAPCRSAAWPGPSTAASRPSRSGSTTARGRRPSWPPCPATTPGASGSTRGRPPPAATPSPPGPPTAPARPRPTSGPSPSPTVPRGWHSVVVIVSMTPR